VDSPRAWFRLAIVLLAGTIGGVGMWSIVVVLPTVQTEFGLDRAGATIPYTLVTIGFAAGGVLMGRLADRFGITVPVVIGGLCLGLGFVGSALAQNLWQFAAAHGLLIGLLGTSATFGPLMADVSLWFQRRRGIAVAVAASGNYLAGTVWPPLIRWAIETYGWRATYMGLGVLCAVTLMPLALLLLPRPPAIAPAAASASSGSADRRIAMSPGLLQALLVVAGVACCVAMSMPQVHIVAYCVDLGYGVARGAEMLSIMLGFGIVSRLLSGWIMDRIGGLKTLLLGSILQATALALYLPSDALVSLYVVSALFGLFQGGIVPSYAVIVRENYPPHEMGTRVGLVVMSTLVGMALGGWLTGAVYDVTGSYQTAFINGIIWNVLNIAIAIILLARSGQDRRPSAYAR
jgi:MFS family permease